MWVLSGWTAVRTRSAAVVVNTLVNRRSDLNNRIRSDLAASADLAAPADLQNIIINLSGRQYK